MPLSNYPVYCWTYFPLDASYPDMVKDWADLGINHPLTPYFGEKDSKEKMTALLDECNEYGLSPIIHATSLSGWSIYETGRNNDWDNYRAKVRRIVDMFGSHPAAYGLYVTDEPDAPDASASFKAARIMTEEAPHLKPYLNLLPWFDWIGERMGTDNLANYLDRCINESGLKEIGYDCYTQEWADDSGWDVYFNNLREYMELKLRRGVDFNTTLLCNNHYKYECKSQSDYRWQISTASAMGAKGLCWFYPDTHNGFGENYRSAPINPFGERTLTFHWLSDEMRIFHHQFGDVMMDLDIDNAFFTSKSYGGVNLFDKDEDLLGISSENTDILLSFFHDSQGTRYLAAVNTSRTENIGVSFTFASGLKPQRKEWNGWGKFGSYTDAVGQNAASAEPSSAYTILSAGQLILIKLAK